MACYRAIPDLQAALALLPELGDSHPAGESLQWIAKLQKLIEERPDKFTKVVTPAEKKMLEGMLERGLGVTRRKVVPGTGKRPAASRKAAPKVSTKPPAKLSTKAATRPRRPKIAGDDLF